MKAMALENLKEPFSAEIILLKILCGKDSLSPKCEISPFLLMWLLSLHKAMPLQHAGCRYSNRATSSLWKPTIMCTYSKTYDTYVPAASSLRNACILKNRLVCHCTGVP